MKRKIGLTLSLTLLISVAFAQTKLIAHKSHSGSKQHFNKSLTNNIFNNKSSNFGMAPQRFVKNAKLDSVIFISKSKAILVTSTCFTDIYIDTASVWNPGREVATNHPLFSKQHALDSIKQIISSQYNFTNPIEKVVFIGYDNKKAIIKTSVKENSVPLINIFNKKNKNPNTPFMLLCVAALFLSVLAYLKFKLTNKKLSLEI